MPLSAYAACTDLGGGVWQTDGNEAADVAECIAAASTGNTINVIAGDGATAWAAPVSVTKAVKIIGPGKTNLTITWSGASAFNINTVDAWRISGFKFSTASSQTAIVISNGSGWRIDANDYTNTQSNSGLFANIDVTVSGDNAYGLIDNNTLYNARILMSNASLSSAGINSLWDDALDLGTANAVYIENNTFDDDGTFTKNDVDSNRGSKYVYRYNNNANGIMAHGLLTGYRASKTWEVYNNAFNSKSIKTWQAIYFRGGTGVIFRNDFTSEIDFNGSIEFDLERKTTCPDDYPDCTDTTTRRGACDGDHEWDGNTGSGDTAGYPCRDQIGRGLDSSNWADYSTRPVPSQDLTPAYIWGNIKDASAVTSVYVPSAGGDNLMIVANQDYYINGASFNGTSGVGSGLFTARPATCTTGVGYWGTDTNILYKCTATDTWSTYYQMYTCPHPLAGAGTCSSVAGRAGYEITEEAVFYDLTITKAGDGSGTVTSSPSGINCGVGCSYSFASGTEVTLTATPSGDYNTFDGWSGEGCSGTGTCVVTMSAAKNVTATFSQTTPDQFAVIVSYAGTGEGTTNPASGSHAYTVAAEVTITATEGANASFTGWSGTCGATGTGSAVFNMPANDCTAIATFADDPKYTLTVTYPGDGITADTDVGGIHCGEYNLDCSAQYYSGATVIVTSTCSTASVFSGDCTGADCSLSMTADKNVSLSCLGAKSTAQNQAGGMTAIYQSGGMTGQ